MKKHNYSAGPCILPQEVFEKSAQAILNFNNSGLSILEISHRSKDFVAVMDEARSLAIELLGLEAKKKWINNIKVNYVEIQAVVKAFENKSFDIVNEIKLTKNGDLVESFLCKWQKTIS